MTNTLARRRLTEMSRLGKHDIPAIRNRRTLSDLVFLFAGIVGIAVRKERVGALFAYPSDTSSVIMMAKPAIAPRVAKSVKPLR